jgi:hypothetical protein
MAFLYWLSDVTYIPLSWLLHCGFKSYRGSFGTGFFRGIGLGKISAMEIQKPIPKALMIVRHAHNHFYILRE